MSDTSFGSGLDVGGGNASGGEPVGADVPPQAPGSDGSGSGGGFGAGLRSILPGPNYRAPDPSASPLDQTADMLQQRITRANSIATNPIAQFFNPDGAAAARNFVPQATEALQKIRTQQATMQANRTQADTLGLSPGEVPDEATQADRVAVAQSKALKGDLRVFKGLQAVDPKAAEAIQDQVHEAVSGHLNSAQYAYDSLAAMPNQGQYMAKIEELRQSGKLGDLEALGLKVPQNYAAFNATKAAEGKALRDARIGVDTIRQKLEERNTYQPMEEKEAKTYNGRITTAYGDQITNGTWGRNGAAGTRGLIVNGAADPRDLGKSFTLATPEQRKAIKEEFDGAVPKEDLEKFRAFTRTYQMATTDDKGKALPDGRVNTNPNVQQGMAEGLASMLRGGSGGANVGLLKIELAKRGWAQGAIDGLISNYNGALNTLFANADRPYLSQTTQKQIRDVMDVLNTYNSKNIGDRTSQIAQRAGALGLDPAALGFGKNEVAGPVGDAIEAGRQAQIARMMPNHQAIGGGDGVLQLGAQRPGSGATTMQPGTAPTTQLSGQPPLATPVQQAQNPQQVPPPGTPSTGPGGQPPAVPPVQAATQPPKGPAGGGGGPQTPQAPVQPVSLAGQSVDPTGMPPQASPGYMQAAQRIESGNVKGDPWKATTARTTASGAFQFTNTTWKDNKPPGAPDRAADATPQQQTAAFAALTTKNAGALEKSGVPVNDTSLYVAHNLGATGATRLLQADPNADARTVVGDTAANNNPKFFKGKPTVAVALARYQAEMANGALQPTPEAEKPGLMSRIARTLGGAALNAVPVVGPAVNAYKALPEAAQQTIKEQAIEHAPAIGSTVGGVAGSAGGPVTAIGAGAAGGAAGQVLKDYLQGRSQDPKKIAEEAALGGVFGIASEARPFVAAAARTLGAGGVEAGAEAARGGSGPDIVDAGLKGSGLAAGGELFGRALGMVGHKVWNLFSPDAKATVQEAAKTYSEASKVLETEAPKLPGANGAAGSANPKYEAAENARTKAEATLKDAGLNPEEAAYAHKVSSEGVPKQEAQAAKPGELERQRVGAGYQQLESEVGDRGVGAPKAAPKLPDGPRAAVESKQVSAQHAELADRVEAAITSPAKSWQDKWVQLKEARSDLLQAERDAATSTAPGRTKTAQDMRTLADTVRTQQEKVAKFVFGEKDGAEFIQRLKVLDTRYRNLMDATNGGDLAAAAALKGESGREADRKFKAFAHDDPQALAAWDAMRGHGGNVEKDVRTLVAVEKLPILGKVVSGIKLASALKEWSRERAAGNPAKFSDIVQLFDDTGRRVRDVTGTAAQRAAVQ